jgi:hypothetical protein
MKKIINKNKGYNMKGFLNISLIIISVLILNQCSSLKFSRGWELIGNQNYIEGITYFQGQLKYLPDNYEINLGLGISYYLGGNFVDGLKYLLIADTIAPTKSEIKYHLGLCSE